LPGTGRARSGRAIRTASTIPRADAGLPVRCGKPAAASGELARIVGRNRYCSQASANVLHCNYPSMAACKKAGAAGNLGCVANPSAATGRASKQR
jgi:hypothetical protein